MQHRLVDQLRVRVPAQVVELIEDLEPGQLRMSWSDVIVPLRLGVVRLDEAPVAAQPHRVGPRVAECLAQTLCQRAGPSCWNSQTFVVVFANMHRVPALVEEHPQAVQARQRLHVDPHVRGTRMPQHAARGSLSGLARRPPDLGAGDGLKSMPIPPRNARKEGTAMSAGKKRSCRGALNSRLKSLRRSCAAGMPSSRGLTSASSSLNVASVASRKRFPSTMNGRS